MKITTIIPVHNILKRGYNRLLLSLYSLAKQTEKPIVIIVDSSDAVQFKKLGTLITDNHPGGIIIKHIHAPAKEFNMPVLFNRGIKEATTEYLHCIGVDFLFKPDYYETLLKYAGPDCFLTTASGRLPKIPGSFEAHKKRVIEWKLPKAPPSPHGKAACGLQFFHKSFPDRFGGYDERFKGWSGMDEEYYYRATKNGITPTWVTDTQSLHIFHQPFKNSHMHSVQRAKNWDLLRQIKSQ